MTPQGGPGRTPGGGPNFFISDFGTNLSEMQVGKRKMVKDHQKWQKSVIKVADFEKYSKSQKNSIIFQKPEFVTQRVANGLKVSWLMTETHSSWKIGKKLAGSEVIQV